MRLAVRQIGRSGHIIGRDDALDAFHRLGLTYINGQNSSMVVLCAKELSVKHPIHFQVGGIFRRTVDRSGAVQPGHVDSYRMTICLGRAGGVAPIPYQLRCIFDGIKNFGVAGTAAQVL